MRIADALVELGYARPEQIAEALEEQRRTGERLADVLVARGVVSRRQLYEAMGRAMSVPFVDLSSISLDTNVLRLVPSWLIRSRRVLPVAVQNGALVLAMCDPLDLEAIVDVEACTRMPVRPCLVDEADYDRAVAGLLELLDAPTGEADGASAGARADLVVDASPNAPGGVEAVVERILEVATRLRASDIHMSPLQAGYSVDVRVDGRVRSIGKLDPAIAQQAIARIKVLAGLDVAESIRPQDGHFAARVLGRDVDVRVAVIGTPNGESLSARLLERRAPLWGLDRLGFTKEQLAALRATAGARGGMILFAGQVGSGKTTAMCALIAAMEREPVMLMSVEDPVEYTMQRVVQIGVQERAGLGFADALRAVLRHDPDVLAVGEIRDGETARLAANAAMAGKLVMATIHSRTPAGALVRMADLGVHPSVLASVVDLVVGCALVRLLCTACRGRGLGRCLSCDGTGYSGRTGLFTVLQMNPRAREAVVARADAEAISRAATWVPAGGVREVAMEMVSAGKTDHAEVSRVLLSMGVGEEVGVAERLVGLS